jgi:hypothetical protein
MWATRGSAPKKYLFNYRTHGQPVVTFFMQLLSHLFIKYWQCWRLQRGRLRAALAPHLLWPSSCASSPIYGDDCFQWTKPVISLTWMHILDTTSPDCGLSEHASLHQAAVDLCSCWSTQRERSTSTMSENNVIMYLVILSHYDYSRIFGYAHKSWVFDVIHRHVVIVFRVITFQSWMLTNLYASLINVPSMFRTRVFPGIVFFVRNRAPQSVTVYHNFLCTYN